MASLVSNATLTSSNKGKIIIIQVTDPNAISLLTNPFKINELLTNNESPFQSLKTTDMRVNRRKMLIVLELESAVDCQLADNLPNINRLGLFTVKCYQPNSDILVHGVIGPIAVDANIESLRDNMIFNPVCRVHAVERMKRKLNGKLEDSLSLKLTFKTKDLPSSVKIFGLFFNIRPYCLHPSPCPVL